MLIEVIDDAAYLSEEQVQLLQNVIIKATERLGLGNNIEVDISIVSNKEIQELNRTYRNMDRPTDVLSFALEEVSSEFDVDFEELTYEEDSEVDEQDIERHLGDIILSYPRAVEQAAEYGHSLERELGFLVVHGFLHLNGYDHQTEEESKAMFALQEEVLTEYGLTR